MQGGRLFRILYLLLAQETLTVSNLAAQLEVSERTIRRDIDSLSASGIPIYTTRGRNGGVSLLPDFVLSKSLLSAREQDEILYALQSFSATGVETAVLGQLSTLFRRQPSDWISIDFSQWGSSDSTKQIFSQLKDAILSEQVIRFDYYASNQKSSQRIVEPHKLHYKGYGWYLQGFCRKRNAFRTFRLSRMDNLSVSSEKFISHEKPPALETSNQTYIPLQEVVIRFSPNVAFRIYDEFNRSQIERQTDGSLLVTAKFPLDLWCASYFLSFGANAEIISPDFVRNELKQLALQVLKKY